MGGLQKFEIVMSILATLGQFLLIWMTYRMYRFAREYDKKMWGRAFGIFLIGMIVATVRLIAVTTWEITQIDGDIGKWIQFFGHILGPSVMVVCIYLFLSILWKWWNQFDVGLKKLIRNNKRRGRSNGQNKEIHP